MKLPASRAAWPSWAKEQFQERAAIIEMDAQMPRAVAEYYAEMDVRKQAADRLEEK
jgi:hypothetical protein